MKIGVFFDPSGEGSVHPLLTTCKNLGIDAAGYRILGGWEKKSVKLLLQYLDRVTHVVLIYSQKSRQSRWFLFLTAFALGRKMQLLVYVPEHVDGGISFSEETLTIERINDLEEVLNREKHRWSEAASFKESREKLISKGYGLTDQEFTRSIIENDKEAAEYFLQIGFAADTCDARGVPVLYHAVKNNFSSLMKLLIERGADVNAVSADRGNTALMEAAGQGLTEELEILLSAGADPDIQSKNGQTALMLAVGEGRSDITETLLSAGAALDITDHLGMTAGKYAKLFKYQAIDELIGNALQARSD
jgi:hypothetical protein